MTATTVTPTPVAPGGRAVPGPTGRVPRRLLAVTELALLALTLVTAASFRRLFVDWAFLPPIALAAILSHGIAAVARRRGWGLLRTWLLSLVLAMLTLTLLFYAGTSLFGFPTLETLTRLRSDLQTAFAPFSDLKAPVEPLDGFVLTAAATIWVTALLADWAAFRNWSPIEAVLVPSAVFLFGSIFGRGDFQVMAAVLFMTGLLVFLLAYRVLRAVSARWIESETRRGSRALLKSGVFALSAAVALGVVVGPMLPGADAPPLVSLRELNNGPGSRVVVSPLVDIQPRLVEQDDAVAFTVESDVPAYWRLTALDDFNGNVWGSNEDFGDAVGALPGTVPDDLRSDTVTQEIDIEELGGIWLPAAFEVRSITTDAPVSHSADSSTIVVSEEVPDSSDITYTVESVIPQIEAADLEPVGPGDDAVDPRYLELPENFSESAVSLARAVVDEAGASTPYAKAIALQNFFRNEFTYNLRVEAGHGVDEIEHFLEVREGYCEQFSGTYAAMARSLGLPARVAVGFTYGEQDPQNPNRYIVRGRHAHAWPEVLIDGFGWLAFEPTPGRGNPSAAPYTGVPAAQEQRTGSGEGTGAPEEPNTGTATTQPSAPTSLSTTSLPGDNTVDAAAEPADTDEARPGAGQTHSARVILALLLVAAVAYLALMPVLVLVLRNLRRPPGDKPMERLAAAWADTCYWLTVIGIVRLDTETAHEFASRVAAALDLPEMRRLGSVVTAATFSPWPPADSTVAEAEDIAMQVASAVKRAATRWQLIRRNYTVRSLTRSPTGRGEVSPLPHA